jgi:hypothetical protein
MLSELRFHHHHFECDVILMNWAFLGCKGELWRFIASSPGGGRFSDVGSMHGMAAPATTTFRKKFVLHF